jgi:hypothetical protein
MPDADRKPECSLFEVILYFENNAWLFSTCAYCSHSEAAIEFAEKEFSCHALHHKLGCIRANSAYVNDRLDDHYFAKRDGRWQRKMPPAEPIPSSNRTSL